MIDELVEAPVGDATTAELEPFQIGELRSTRQRGVAVDFPTNGVRSEKSVNCS